MSKRQKFSTESTIVITATPRRTPATMSAASWTSSCALSMLFFVLVISTFAVVAAVLRSVSSAVSMFTLLTAANVVWSELTSFDRSFVALTKPLVIVRTPLETSGDAA